MTKEPLKPASSRLIEICDAIDEAISSYLSSRIDFVDPGRYEGLDEANNLMYMVIRQSQAIVTLARQDLVLLPAAMVCGLAAFEAATVALWIVSPFEHMAQEARYLAHLKTAETELRRQVEPGSTKSETASSADTLKEFREGISSKLPSSIEVPTKRPGVRQRLVDMNLERFYPLYRLLCSYAHNDHSATALYRKNLGTLKESGEYIRESDWALPLICSWFGMAFVGRHVVNRYGAEEDSFMTPDTASKIDSMIRSLQPD